MHMKVLLVMVKNSNFYAANSLEVYTTISLCFKICHEQHNFN